MQRFSHYLPIIFIVLMVIFSACSKEGSQGATGPAGPAGPAGATGPAGPKGDTGVANVIYSGWLDVTYMPDTLTQAGKLDTLGWLSAINVPKLSLTILNTGDIKVFINLNTAASPVVVSVPYVDETFGLVRFVAAEKILNLLANFNASTRLNSSNVKVIQYRYVLIPGGTAARSSSGVNWNDYKSVQKYLGLKD